MLFALAVSPAFAQDGLLGTSKQKEALSPKLQLQLQAVYREKESRTPAMRKMDQDLIFAVRQAKGENLRKDLPDLEIPNIVNKDGTVDVELLGPVTASLIAQLRALGGQIQTAYPKYSSVSARLKVNVLESVALLPGVRRLKTQDKYMSNSGSKQSEGDKSLRADEARTHYGLTGAGVKIGILSDSDKYRENSQSTGDLPATIEVPNGQDGRSVANNTGEGTAMMELAYDLAPGSSYAFNTAYSTQAAFAQHYTDLFNAGCKVLADDIFYFAEPAFQDGPIAKAINDIVRGGGIVFSAAGNEGNSYSNYSGVWEGDFVNSGTNYVNGSYNFPMHSFGASTRNQITNRGNGYLTLQWNDQWTNCTSDYDLFVLNQNGGLTAYAATTNVGGSPYEQVTVAAFSSPNTRSVMVTKYSGGDFVLRANMLRGKLATTIGGQTWGHSASEYCIGTGTINAATSPQRAFTATDVPTYYTSDGYRRIFYNEAGQLIAPDTKYASAVLRQQPVITSVDGVTTTVPGFVPFYGTSAAAPQAAAVAALLKEFAPDATPAELRNALTTGAIDLLTQGWDKTTGFGAVNTMGAIKVLLETKTLGVSPASTQVFNTTSGALTLDLGRNAPASGLTVNVSASGDTAQFNIPTTLTIPAGSSTGVLNVTSKDAGSGSVTLTFRETYTNAALGTATVQRGVDTAISELKLSAASVVGGTGSVTVKAQLNRAVDSYPVEFSSSNPAVASVPSTGLIRKNYYTAVPVTTYPVSVDTPVVIGVRKQGSSDSWIETTLLVRADDAAVSEVRLGATSTVGGTVLPAKAILSEAAASDTPLEFTTDSPSLVTLPATATVKKGGTYTSFSVTTKPVADDTTVTVGVRRQGSTGPWTETSLQIKAPTPVAFTLGTGSGYAGTVVTGTVTLNGPAPAGYELALESGNPGLFSVPATVTFAQGSKKGTFTANVGAASAPTTVQVSVSKNGTGLATANYKVLVPEVKTLVLSPATVKGGKASTGKITLNHAAPAGGLVVSLMVGGTGASVPASVTVPAGSTKVNFTITTTATAEQKVVTVTAGSVSATLTINP